MKINRFNLEFGSLNIVQTSKFKTIRVQISFQSKISKKDVTKRALLPNIMRAINKDYDTRIKMQTKLEDMYGASFTSGVRKIGLTQEIIFDMHILHPNHTFHQDNLLEETFRLLHSVLFKPKLDKDILEEEKRQLEEYFLSIYGDKMRYSLIKLQQLMYDDLYSVDAMGIYEDLGNITLDDLYDALTKMINNDVITINIVGDITPSVITPLIKAYLPFKKRLLTRTIIDKNIPLIKNKTIEEIQDITQAKLVIGYNLPVYYLSDDYYKAAVFNTLFGGGSESLLFKSIREDQNLVYFIGSFYDQYKGSLIVYAGINQKDFEKLMLEVDQIILDLKNGIIDKELLSIAKKSIIQSVIESLDSNLSLANRVNHLAMFDRAFNKEQIIQNVNNVSMVDIKNIANQLQKNTTFFLRGKNNENI